MKQKHTLVILSMLVLTLSGCGSSPKYITPESRSVYRPEIKKNPTQPIPTDILQKYKRIRSITGEIINSNQSYAMVQKE